MTKQRVSRKQKHTPVAQRLYGRAPKLKAPKRFAKDVEIRHLRDQLSTTQQQLLDLANVGLTAERLATLTTRLSTAVREIHAVVLRLTGERR